MKIEVLVSTMNLDSRDRLLKKMNLSKDYVVINQSTNKKRNFPDEDSVYTFFEKGLSRSRNRALNLASGDIVLIADDDMTYENNFRETVSSAYRAHPDADVIAFYVEDFTQEDGIHKGEERAGRVGVLRSMKLRSVQLSFRRESLRREGLNFDEMFGAGTEMFMGEENIFLMDCLNKGLRIYSVPVKIATLNSSESTWFRGFDEKYLQVKGATFGRMAGSHLVALLFIFQFAVRKKRLFGNSTLTGVLMTMYKGLKEYYAILK